LLRLSTRREHGFIPTVRAADDGTTPQNGDGKERLSASAYLIAALFGLKNKTTLLIEIDTAIRGGTIDIAEVDITLETYWFRASSGTEGLGRGTSRKSQSSLTKSW
jgi:hypothetical protein